MRIPIKVTVTVMTYNKITMRVSFKHIKLKVITILNKSAMHIYTDSLIDCCFLNNVFID